MLKRRNGLFNFSTLCVKPYDCGQGKIVEMYNRNMRELQTAIITNMCLVYKDDEILVQKRTKSDWPGITFPGGHVEKGENFDESIKREIKEETGLDIYNPKLCGIEEFKTTVEDRHIILLYKCNEFKGELKPSSEGEVFWIKRKDLETYELSQDLDIMLEIIENDSLSEIIYSKDENGWSYKLV